MKTRSAHNNEGVALLLALLFVILLSAIVVEYCYEMQVEATLVSSQSDELQAYVAAKSAIAAGISVISSSQQTAGTGTTNPPRKVNPDGSGTPGNDAADTLLDAWTIGVPIQTINEANMMATIVDEYGKLNLNALVDTETDQPRENVEKILRALFKARKVELDPTDAIIDWLDVNEDSQGSAGAESDTYQSLTVPYHAKNGPMTSVEELLLIKGITPAVYFGDPDQDQWPLPDLLTVHGDAKGRVNINTAKVELLTAMGDALNGKPELGDLVEKRMETEPFTSDEDVKSGLAGYDDAVLKMFTVSSKMFRIFGNGWAGETDPVRVRVEAYVARQSGGTGGTYKLVDWRVIR